jgi:hypothetical protein
MSGLASYEILKTGFGSILICCFLSCSIYYLITTLNAKYVSTQDCNIVSNNDGTYTQVLTYIVNGKTYTKNIPPVLIKNDITKRTNYNFANPSGKCIAYYSSANPDDVKVNFNPTTIAGLMTGGLACCIIFVCIYLSFLRANPDFAGVMGGISASQNVIGAFRR